jgi:hypothetical protein
VNTEDHLELKWVRSEEMYHYDFIEDKIQSLKGFRKSLLLNVQNVPQSEIKPKGCYAKYHYIGARS